MWLFPEKWVESKSIFLQAVLVFFLLTQFPCRLMTCGKNSALIRICWTVLDETQTVVKSFYLFPPFLWRQFSVSQVLQSMNMSSDVQWHFSAWWN